VVSAGISRNFDESEFSRFHCNFLATAARENRIKQGGERERGRERERERERERGREGEGDRAAVSPRFPPFRESELIYFRSNSIACESEKDRQIERIRVR